MEVTFEKAPKGIFRRYNGLCYVKFSDTQACIITNGEVVDIPLDEVVISYVMKN